MVHFVYLFNILYINLTIKTSLTSLATKIFANKYIYKNKQLPI